MRNAGGINMSFRREAFDVRLFDDSLGGGGGTQSEGKLGPVVEDHEFSVRVKMKTLKEGIFEPRLRIWHKVYAYRLTPKYIRRQAYWQGYGKVLLKRRFGSFWKPDVEFNLLRQVLRNLILEVFSCLISEASRKRVSLTVRVLFYIALGCL